MTEQPPAVDVVEQPEHGRFVASVHGHQAGLAEYMDAQGLRVFTHTEVDPAYEGKGIGSAIARVALDDVRARGVKVLPLCPFIAGWIARHPDYADLVYSRPATTATD